MTVKRTAFAAVALSFLVCLTGCPLGGLANQINQAVSGATKISNGQLSQLTTAEVVAINEIINQVEPEVPLIGEEIATGIVKFFQLNGINTVEDAETAIQAAQDDPDSIIIPEELGGSLEALEDLLQNWEAAA